MNNTTDGRSFVWAVFDADGCECKTLSAVFGNESQAIDFAARLQASDDAEFEEMYGGEDWKPDIRRIISVEALEIGLEPDIGLALRVLQEN